MFVDFEFNYNVENTICLLKVFTEKGMDFIYCNFPTLSTIELKKPYPITIEIASEIRKDIATTDIISIVKDDFFVGETYKICNFKQTEELIGLGIPLGKITKNDKGEYVPSGCVLPRCCDVAEYLRDNESISIEPMSCTTDGVPVKWAYDICKIEHNVINILYQCIDIAEETNILFRTYDMCLNNAISKYIEIKKEN